MKCQIVPWFWKCHQVQWGDTLIGAKLKTRAVQEQAWRETTTGEESTGFVSKAMVSEQSLAVFFGKPTHIR